jgi:hypothetical protein
MSVADPEFQVRVGVHLRNLRRVEGIKREHMPKNVQVLAWNSHKNVVGLNRFVGTPF